MKEKLRLKCAEVDGFKIGDSITFPQYFYKGIAIYTVREDDGNPTLPYYDNETDILRVVRLLDEVEYLAYTLLLTEEFGVDAFRVTADKQMEALAKVWGIE